VVLPVNENRLAANRFLLENPGSFNLATYVKLRTPDDLARVNAGLDAFVQGLPGISGPDFKARLRYRLAPITKIHLGLPDWQAALKIFQTPGDRQEVVLFAGIAAAILAMAVVNFLNATAARVAGRRREIALRCVLGARTRHILGQLLLEAGLVVAAALLIAVILIETATPALEGFFRPQRGVRRAGARPDRLGHRHVRRLPV